MTLDELIDRLEKMPPDAVPPVGFSSPHSYRGYYNDLAFEPTKGVSFGEMLEAAKGAKGETMTGYKGGEYVMNGWVDCYLAKWGWLGEGIGSVLLDYMEMTAQPSRADPVSDRSPSEAEGR